ncbi:MAG: hypothetical protein H7A48_01250 [Akkermansiaceae bacterium]|nr:hypothetical protein [Akkermansiaceae bacterium]MCP5546241.1 hypothetical protein [Akkermansiaceae bacterium]
MKVPKIALLAIALGVGVALGALMGGGFIHTIIARFLCIWIAAPAAILLMVTGIEKLRHRDQARGMSSFMVGCAGIALTILGFTGGGAAAFQYRESEVRTFVAQVVPLLDAHKKTTGSYPLHLDEVTDQRLPHYLKGSGRYTSDGDTFTFYYENPDSIMSGLMLTDSHRTWSRAD